jgi:hypothetical protein
MTVSVRIVDAGVNDTLQVWNGATQAALGTVDLRRNFVTTGYMAFATSSIVQSGSTITITIGGTATANGGAAWQAAPGAGTMRWTPSASATDPAGNPMATTQISESGASDADF